MIAWMLPVPGSTVKYFAGKYCRYFVLSQYFGFISYCTADTASTGSISRFCTADTACTPNISGFDTAGPACARGAVLLILEVRTVFGPSVLLILPVLTAFRPPVLQTPVLYEILRTKCRYLPSIPEVSSILGASVNTCLFRVQPRMRAMLTIEVRDKLLEVRRETFSSLETCYQVPGTYATASASPCVEAASLALSP